MKATDHGVLAAIRKRAGRDRLGYGGRAMVSKDPKSEIVEDRQWLLEYIDQFDLDAISLAIGTNEFLDPPDGGGPSLAEQVRRMKEQLDTLRIRADVNVCACCKNTFVQPLVCTTCGSKRLYDLTMHTIVAERTRAQYLLMEMMKAYERRVRSDCNSQEEIDRRPWECAEYLIASDFLIRTLPDESLSGGNPGEPKACTGAEERGISGATGAGQLPDGNPESTGDSADRRSPDGTARTPSPDESNRHFERGCHVIMELMQAYERRVRSDCTTQEQLDKRPWECAEYIKAAEYLRKVWPPHEPTGLQCEKDGVCALVSRNDDEWHCTACNGDFVRKQPVEPGASRLADDEGIVCVLASHLAKCDGHDDPNHLIWEGGPIPEPWGEVWCRYEEPAKEILRLVDGCLTPKGCTPVEPLGTQPILPTKETMMESVSSTSDERTVNNVMRHAYRVLSDAEKAQMQAIKDKGLEFWELIDSVGASRELSLAKTASEEAVMWAVKHITR